MRKREGEKERTLQEQGTGRLTFVSTEASKWVIDSHLAGEVVLSGWVSVRNSVHFSSH